MLRLPRFSNGKIFESKGGRGEKKGKGKKKKSRLGQAAWLGCTAAPFPDGSAYLEDSERKRALLACNLGLGSCHVSQRAGFVIGSLSRRPRFSFTGRARQKCSRPVSLSPPSVSIASLSLSLFILARKKKGGRIDG